LPPFGVRESAMPHVASTIPMKCCCIYVHNAQGKM
jgi:hypothetical protein